MNIKTRTLTGIACSLLAAGAACAGDLPAALSARAGALGLDPAGIVVGVVDLGDGRRVVDYRTDVPAAPASTAKLVSTLAALEELGAAHRFRTDFAVERLPGADGRIGKLYIRGGGDPTWVVEEFDLDLMRLRALGVKRIDGDVVLDRSLFEPEDASRNDFDGRGSRPYNSLPDAALVNYRSLSFDIRPDKDAGVARVVGLPALDGVSYPRTLPLSKGACGRWRDKIGYRLDPAGDGYRVRFTGSFPASCGEKSFNVVSFSADEYFERLFRASWKRLGGVWKGRVVEGAAPEKARVLYSRTSRPLSDVVRLTNKFSNNLLARHLFLALGSADGREGGVLSKERSRAWLARWSAEHGLDPKGVFIDNGSGLSRETRVTGRFMTDLLVEGWNGPYMSEYLSSLPITGEDGTMRNRAVAPRYARIKTGLISGVRAVGGYVHAENGRRYAVFAVVEGDRNIGNGIPFLNSVIDWVDKLPGKAVRR